MRRRAASRRRGAAAAAFDATPGRFVAGALRLANWRGGGRGRGEGERPRPRCARGERCTARRVVSARACAVRCVRRTAVVASSRSCTRPGRLATRQKPGPSARGTPRMIGRPARPGRRARWLGAVPRARPVRASCAPPARARGSGPGRAGRTKWWGGELGDRQREGATAGRFSGDGDGLPASTQHRTMARSDARASCGERASCTRGSSGRRPATRA